MSNLARTFAPCRWAALAAAGMLAPACAQSMDYPALEQLFREPVTTSATGSPQRAREVAADMTIITADEIRRSGARDLPGILRHVPGIDILQWDADDVDVSIRGYDQPYSARILVLVDGRQIYADFYGFVPWNTLPVELSEIRQIEIVRGPNAALFGFNAVGGVINIVTRNPRHEAMTELTARAGTQGLLEVSAAAMVKLGSGGALRLSAGASTDQGYNTPAPPAIDYLRRRPNYRYEFDAYATFDLTDKIQFDIDAGHNRSRRFELNAGMLFNNTSYTTQSIRARLAADTEIGLMTLTAYGNWMLQKTELDPIVGQFRFDNNLQVVQAEDAFNIGSDHTVRLAAEYRHDATNTSSVAGGQLFYDDWSQSGMWNWSLTPTLTLTNAVRYDYLALGRSGTVPPGYPFVNSDWDRAIQAVSFNSALVWKAGDSDVFRLIAGRGAQLPSLADLGSFLSVSPLASMTGAPDVRPAITTAFELAWDREIGLVSGSLHSVVFYQDSADLQSLSGGLAATATGVWLTSTNFGGSRAEGLEISIDGAPAGGWRWSLAYRGEMIQDHFLPFAAGKFDYAHFNPKHLIKARLGWSGHDWEIDTYLSYQSATMSVDTSGASFRQAPVSPFATFDARVARRLTDWATIAISGQNLIESPQRQTLLVPVQRQVFVTLTLQH